MGKSSSQVVGYRYYANFLAFIGNRIEDLLAINFDKRGWETGRQVPMGENGKMLYIHLPNIYGENEGGVSGALCLKYGSDTQSPDPAYKKYTDSFGSFAPAYPFQSYISFSGFELASRFSQLSEAELQVLADQYNDGIIPGRGFYLGNSGYMKEMLLWVKRTRVRNDGRGQWYGVREDGAVVCEIGAYSKGEIIEVPPTTNKFVTVEYHGKSETMYENTVVTVDQEPTSILAVAQYNGDMFVAFEEHFQCSVGHTYIYDNQYDRGNKTANMDYKISNLGSIAGKFHTIFTILISGDKYDDFNIETDGIIFKKDVLDDYYTVTNWVKLRRITFEIFGTHATYFKVSARAERTKKEYDPIHLWVDGLHTAVSFEIFEYLPLLKGDFETNTPDINPIHKIREILTDDTAMGKPESDVNNANFMKAADRIYDEGLGVSWAIDEKSCIEAIEELCYHIEAGIRVNRQTGLYEMVLFRDDWFAEEEIHDIAENKIKDLSLEVMNSDDIVNQLNVTYYDRERIKNSTFSVYENGSILTMGHANAESVEFPYFMNMRNAEIVANWKLKQFSTPAWSGSFATGWKEARKWNRYDLIRLPWSKKWNGTILVRIMKINLGNGTDNTVTIDFEEVIPYSGEMNTSIVVDNPIDSAPQPPQSSINAVFEAPYYLTVLRAGQTNTDLELSNNPEIGYVAAIAAKPQNNSLNALLYTDGGVGEFEQVSRLDYCDILQLDQPINETMSAFVVTGSLTQSANSNNFILLNDELMGFVSFDSETKVLTVKRGVLDTVPKKHNSGDLFVFDLPDVAFDSTQYAQSEIVEAQVLTTTPSGIQDLSAIGAAVEIQARAIRPYPPANVKINGEYWLEEVEGSLSITWAHRNRKQQTGGAPIDWYAGGVTKEDNILYDARIYSAQDNTLFAEELNIDSDTITFDSTNAPQLAKLILESRRDGYTCLYPYQHVFAWGEPPEIFITAFTSSGTFTVPESVTSVDVLVVAGGGGGGSRQGGGGGAGGLIVQTVSVIPLDVINVTVGLGGAGGVNGGQGADGQNSSFGSIVATGGGGGGGRTVETTGRVGGSGGGGSGVQYVPGVSAGGASILAQGSAGGQGGGVNIGTGGGGGGGAGGVGGTYTEVAGEHYGGDGGVGVHFQALENHGSGGWFAGGGGGAKNGGGNDYSAGGLGGLGGGGRSGYPFDAATSAALPQSGQANTGGGGGGSFLGTESGGNGGSGIVIIATAGTFL